MGQDATATIVYGFEIEDLPQVEECDDSYDITAKYHAILMDRAGIGPAPDWSVDRDAWQAWRDRSNAVIHRAPEILDWGCDGGDTALVVGVSALRASWDGAEVLDLKDIESAQDYYSAICAFCEFLGIPMQGCDFLLLCEFG